MAIVFCTGPCFVWVSFRAGDITSFGPPLFLGTCEDTPSATLRPSTHPVINSVSGGVPHDASYQGEEAFIGLDLTRYNAVTMTGVRNRTKPSGPGTAPEGSMAFGDLGTLALTEGWACVLYLRFPYAVKPVFAAAGMPAGYRFLGAMPVGPDDLGHMGTKHRKERVLFHTIPIYNFVTGGHVLYDHDMAAIPLVPLE